MPNLKNCTIPESRYHYLKQYSDLYKTAVVKPEKLNEINKIIEKIISLKPRYEKLNLNIPWWVIGIIHYMESNFDLKRHLHNGDLLIARTVKAPAGRPKVGNPPFTWEESAVDALLDRCWYGDNLEQILYFFEAYNGFGYRNKKVNSPYLWSYTNHYTGGKFVEKKDPRTGTYKSFFDTSVSSKQAGACAIIKTMESLKLIENIKKMY